MWTCSNCNRNNEDESKFCAECGNVRPLKPINILLEPEGGWLNQPELKPNEPAPQPVWTPPEPQPAPQPAWTAPAPQTRKTKKGLLIGITGALVLAALALVLILVLRTPVFRPTHVRTQNQSEMITDVYYSYSGRMGRAELYRNGSRIGYESLTLNDKGLVVSVEKYNQDNVLQEYRVYEYDKEGNAVSQCNYREDGTLYRSYEMEYGKYHVCERYVTREYSGGKESSRVEFSMTDRTHGQYSAYRDGVLQLSAVVERTFDGNLLVGEREIRDGTLVMSKTWTRDKYGNPIYMRIEYPDGMSQTTSYEYEKAK